MENIIRRFKPLALAPADIQHLGMAQHILLQSLFVAGNRPRGKISCLDEQGVVIHELTAGANILFLSSRLKEPRVESHLIIANTQIHPVWTTFVGILKPKDEIEIVWLPDSHTTVKMLKAGITGDSIKLVCHRGNKQAHYLISVVTADDNDSRPLKLITRKPFVHELNGYVEPGDVA